MSYTPTEWETGQTITAEKLNKLEQGVADAGGGSDLPEVTADDKDKYLHTNSSTGDLEWSAVSGGGGAFVVTEAVDETTGDDTLDKTYAEILAAAEAGMMVIVHRIFMAGSLNILYLSDVFESRDGDFTCVFVGIDNDEVSRMTYLTDSENGYPVLQASGEL